MTKAVYDVDKEHQFNAPIIILIREELKVFVQESFGIGISSTDPKFLGKLRAVNYDGSIASKDDCDIVTLYPGYVLVIYPEGDIGFFDKDDNYFTFEGNDAEKLTRSRLPFEAPVIEGVFMTQGGLETYLNSYRISPKKKTEKDREEVEMITKFGIVDVDED